MYDLPKTAVRYGIATQPVRRGSQRTDTYEFEGLKRAADEREEEKRIRPSFGPSTEVASILGIARSSVQLLASAGRLRTLSVPGATLYSIEDALELLRRFDEAAAGRTDTPMDRNIGALAVRWPWIDTVKLIGAVLAGAIRVARPRTVPLHQGRFPARGLNAYVLEAVGAERFAHSCRSHLTRSQASAATGIPIELVEEMIRRGHLVEDKDVVVGTMSTVGITAASVSAFVERFAHTVGIRKAAGPGFRVSREMTRLGIPEIERLTRQFVLYDRLSVAKALGWDVPGEVTDGAAGDP